MAQLSAGNIQLDGVGIGGIMEDARIKDPPRNVVAVDVDALLRRRVRAMISCDTRETAAFSGVMIGDDDSGR